MIKREKNQFCVTVRQNHGFFKDHDFLNVIVLFSNFCLLIKTAWKPDFLSDIVKRIVRLSDEIISQSFNHFIDT
jgi:hypothetical protein